MYFEIYQDNRGEWRWTLKAGNHETIAVSSEGYHNRADCLHGINLVKQSANAPVRERV